MRWFSQHHQQGTPWALFRRITIRRRLAWVLGLMVVMLALAIGVMLHAAIQSYEAYIVQAGSNLVGDVMGNIDTGISSLLAVTKYPVVQSKRLPTDTYNHLAYPATYGKTVLYADLEYNSIFLFEQNRKIRLIAIFDLQGDGAYVKNNRKYTYQVALSQVPAEERGLTTEPWFVDTLASRGSGRIWHSGQVRLSQIALEDKQDMLFVSRAIMSFTTFDPLGAVLAAVDIGDCIRLFEASRRLPRQAIAVFNQSGELLWGDLPPDPIQGFMGTEAYRNGPSAGALTLTLGGQTHMVQYVKGVNGLACLLATPYADVVFEALSQRWAFSAALLAGCLVIGLLLRGIIRSIVDPVKALASTCNQIVAEAHFSVTIADPHCDELSELTTAFNALTQRIEHLIYDVYEKRIELTNTELQLLRSQVNPHFLYNTLETIRSKASLSGQVELGDMALLLASILRYGISAPGEWVRVEQEVQKLREYLALQHTLYQDRFTANISIDDDILPLMTIKFILQPLVENALYHGLNALASPGMLEVLGYQEGEDIVFQVIDNGGGIDPAMMADLRDYLENKHAKFKSIGLKNVHRRLRLLYGADYGVTLQSQPNVGTLVSVRIPKVKADEKQGGES